MKGWNIVPPIPGEKREWPFFLPTTSLPIPPTSYLISSPLGTSRKPLIEMGVFCWNTCFICLLGYHTCLAFVVFFWTFLINPSLCLQPLNVLRFQGSVLGPPHFSTNPYSLSNVILSHRLKCPVYVDDSQINIPV